LVKRILINAPNIRFWILWDCEYDYFNISLNPDPGFRDEYGFEGDEEKESDNVEKPAEVGAQKVE